MAPDEKEPTILPLLTGLSKFAKNAGPKDTVVFAERPGPTPEEIEARMNAQAERRKAQAEKPPAKRKGKR